MRCFRFLNNKMGISTTTASPNNKMQWHTINGSNPGIMFIFQPTGVLLQRLGFPHHHDGWTRKSRVLVPSALEGGTSDVRRPAQTMVLSIQRQLRIFHLSPADWLLLGIFSSINWSVYNWYIFWQLTFVSYGRYKMWYVFVIWHIRLYLLFVCIRMY